MWGGEGMRFLYNIKCWLDNFFHVLYVTMFRSILFASCLEMLMIQLVHIFLSAL